MFASRGVGGEDFSSTRKSFRSVASVHDDFTTKQNIPQILFFDVPLTREFIEVQYQKEMKKNNSTNNNNTTMNDNNQLDIYHGHKLRRKPSLFTRDNMNDYILNKYLNEMILKLNENIIFTDIIYKYNNKYFKQSRIIILTNKNIYYLEPNNLKIKGKIELNNINDILLTPFEDGFIMIKTNKLEDKNIITKDYLFESNKKTIILINLLKQLNKNIFNLKITEQMERINKLNKELIIFKLNNEIQFTQISFNNNNIITINLPKYLNIINYNNDLLKNIPNEILESLETNELYENKKLRRRESILKWSIGDYLHLKNNKIFLKINKKYNDQDILYSNIITKVNKNLQLQKRNFILTENAIYNLNEKFKIKRRILLKDIKAITISTMQDSFFILRVPNEYDYFYFSVDKSEIIYKICKQFRIPLIIDDHVVYQDKKKKSIKVLNFINDNNCKQTLLLPSNIGGIIKVNNNALNCFEHVDENNTINDNNTMNEENEELSFLEILALTENSVNITTKLNNTLNNNNGSNRNSTNSNDSSNNNNRHSLKRMSSRRYVPFDIYMGRKIRRRESIDRQYYNNYLSIFEFNNCKNLITQYQSKNTNLSIDDISKIMFSSRVFKLNNKYKTQKRILVITEYGLFNIEQNENEFKIKDIINCRDNIIGVSVSTLPDDFFCIHCKEGKDILFVSDKKTEILNHLLTLRSNLNLGLDINVTDTIVKKGKNNQSIQLHFTQQQSPKQQDQQQSNKRKSIQLQQLTLAQQFTMEQTDNSNVIFKTIPTTLVNNEVTNLTFESLILHILDKDYERINSFDVSSRDRPLSLKFLNHYYQLELRFYVNQLDKYNLQNDTFYLLEKIATVTDTKYQEGIIHLIPREEKYEILLPKRQLHNSRITRTQVTIQILDKDRNVLLNAKCIYDGI
ncbi:hypothetical protein ABK040_012960 [Willaertia magna]